MPATVRVAPALAATLAAIEDAREAAFDALREANRTGLSGTSLAAVAAPFDDVDASVTRVKTEHFPRYKGRLVVALGSALRVSPTGRSSRIVWTRA